MAGEDVLLTVERQVIAILARDRLGQEPRPRQPLVDRLGRLVREGDVLLARATGVAKSRVLDHEERGRDVLQLLADLFADLDAHVAAVGTGQFLGGQLVFDPLPGQMFGEPLPSPAPPVPPRFRDLRLRRLLDGRLGDAIRGVGEQAELGGIDALPPGTVLAAEQLLDLVLQLLDPPLRLPDRVRLLADDLVAESQVVGKRRGGLAHAKILRPWTTSKRGPRTKISCGLPLVPSLPPDAAQVDPVEDHHQVRRLDLHALRRVRRRGREAKGPAFQALVPVGQAVSIPVEDLDPIAAPVAEDIQVTRERVEPEGRPDQFGQTVEPFSHVGRLGAQEDPDGRGPAQHRRPSSRARTSPRVLGSKPEGTRTVGPPGSTISIGGADRVETASRSTTLTGRKAGAASVGSPSCSPRGAGEGCWSRRANSCRHHQKVQSFNPSRRQKSRTASPLRSCRRTVHRQNFSLAGSRRLPPRLAMLASPRHRRIGSRRSYHGVQDGVRNTDTISSWTRWVCCWSSWS